MSRSRHLEVTKRTHIAYPPDTLVIRIRNGEVGVIAKECVCSLTYSWGVHYEILWDDDHSLSSVSHDDIKSVFYE